MKKIEKCCENCLHKCFKKPCDMCKEHQAETRIKGLFWQPEVK